MSSIDLFYKSFRHATLQLSALGYSENHASNMGACCHPSFALSPVDISTIARSQGTLQGDMLWAMLSSCVSNINGYPSQ